MPVVITFRQRISSIHVCKRWPSLSTSTPITAPMTSVGLRLGLDFYLVGNQLKLMANYIFKTEQKREIHHDSFILQLNFSLYPNNPRLKPGIFSA